MTQVSWIIENLVKEPSFLELSEEAKKQGFPVQDIKGDFAHADISHYKDQCVIFNGSIEMCKLVKSNLIANGNSPITYSTFENYLCSKYYGIFGKYLFNDRYVMLPLSELHRNFYHFYGVYGKEAMLFIRPDSGDKLFKAGLFDLKDFEDFYNQYEEFRNELTIVSTPKNIRGEWRFVCTRHKEILAVSSYRYQGLTTKVPSAPTKATKLCEEILSVGYYPDSVFCIDICEDNDGDFWLMELTSFSSAGLYATKKELIVKRVSEIALEDYYKSKNIISKFYHAEGGHGSGAYFNSS